MATPGRLWELMQQGHAHLTDMAELSFFVLDEADRMVQQGHFQVCRLDTKLCVLVNVMTGLSATLECRLKQHHLQLYTIT